MDNNAMKKWVTKELVDDTIGTRYKGDQFENLDDIGELMAPLAGPVTE